MRQLVQTLIQRRFKILTVLFWVLQYPAQHLIHRLITTLQGVIQCQIVRITWLDLLTSHIA